MINIRPAKITDAEAVFRVQRDTWLDVYPNVEHGVKRDDIAARYADAEAVTGRIRDKIGAFGQERSGWVAETEGQVVGFAMTRDLEGAVELIAIYVWTVFQGKGLGGRLMDTIIDHYRGQDMIWLKVAIYNTKSIAFYEHYGFRQIPKSEGMFEFIRGKYIPTIKMERENGLKQK